MSKTFGEILRKVRKEKGLSSIELSRLLGISQSTLSKYEKDKTKGIKYDLIIKICEIFEIDANHIFDVAPQNESCNVHMQKAEELKKALEYARDELEKLASQDIRVCKIIEELDSFIINTDLGKESVKIYYGKGVIGGGLFREDELYYALSLMNFFCELYYECRKTILKIEKVEYSTTINALLLYLGRILREQSLYKIKPNRNFKAEEFYGEFKKFITISVGALGHKCDQIGDLTNYYDPQEAEELKHIREIYETICFKEGTIEYFDYIAGVTRAVNANNSVEMQYMTMNLYAKAYAESVLWLKKEDPYGQWCPTTPWQIITNFKLIISKYFFY